MRRRVGEGRKERKEGREEGRLSLHGDAMPSYCINRAFWSFFSLPLYYVWIASALCCRCLNHPLPLVSLPPSLSLSLSLSLSVCVCVLGGVRVWCVRVVGLYQVKGSKRMGWEASRAKWIGLPLLGANGAKTTRISHAVPLRTTRTATHTKTA